MLPVTGATDFTRRSQKKMAREPWIAPFVSMTPSEEYPDPFMRNDSLFIRDMIRLVPGQSYTGFIRVPDDSVLRLIDLSMSVYQYRNGRYWLTNCASGDSHYGVSAGTPYQAFPLYDPVDSLINEIEFKLSDASSGETLVDVDATANLFQALRPRPGGPTAIVGRLVPPRGALQFTLTHTGDSPVLAVAGSFRGYRMRF
jgi:hypothetical protein